MRAICREGLAPGDGRKRRTGAPLQGVGRCRLDAVVLDCVVLHQGAGAEWGYAGDGGGRGERNRSGIGQRDGDAGKVRAGDSQVGGAARRVSGVRVAFAQGIHERVQGIGAGRYAADGEGSAAGEGGFGDTGALCPTAAAVVIGHGNIHLAGWSRRAEGYVAGNRVAQVGVEACGYWAAGNSHALGCREEYGARRIARGGNGVGSVWNGREREVSAAVRRGGLNRSGVDGNRHRRLIPAVIA